MLVFRDDPYLKSCDARVVSVRADFIAPGQHAIELDRTVFYPSGGGQPGDSGTLRLADASELRVVDTRKGDAPGQVLHILAPASPLPPADCALEAAIDWERRYAHMRFHTALHLLCSVVAAPVTGGRMAADKAHLDFDVEMERLDRHALESGMNALVEAAHTIQPRWISGDELDARPELVKTMSVAPPRNESHVRLIEIPGVDLQACGGTHVANTREIGRIAVTRIRSEGRRNRRVTIAFAA